MVLMPLCILQAGLWTQIKAAATRQYQLMWNDKASLAIKQGSSIVQSIILGSVFYRLPQTTGGIFTRGGTYVARVFTRPNSPSDPFIKPVLLSPLQRST